MIPQSIEILIIKYFTNQINTDEVSKLTAWVKQNENSALFKDYINVNFTIEELKMVSYSNDNVWKVIKKQINNSKRHSVYWKYAAAASVLLLVTLSIFFTRKDNVITPTPIIVDNKIEIGTTKATLTLEDGSTIILGKGKLYQSSNVTSTGEDIIYNEVENSTNTSKEIVYNVLTIPRGGLFSMHLSDGTKVWLNSDSKIKYPKSFAKGEDRIVELMYGEAYFDVSPSTAHNGAIFKVVSQHQEIAVLGTEFNVKAYQDEASTYTTLVEGQIVINNGIDYKQLNPNQQAIISANSDIIISAIDVYNEVSWRNGTFSFNGKTLKEIMTVMSRWYNVDIVFENKALEDIKFIGVFRKNQNIEHILLTIKNTDFINSFEIKGQKIILN